jgi:hypothetical protein
MYQSSQPYSQPSQVYAPPPQPYGQPSQAYPRPPIYGQPEGQRHGQPSGADPQLWQLFSEADIDRSGSIKINELQRALVNGEP